MEPFSWSAFLFDVGTKVVGEHIGHLFLGAAIGGGAALYTNHMVKRTLRGARKGGPIAYIQTTWYTPAIKKAEGGERFEWALDPKTGRPLREQKIRVEERPVRIRDIFNDEADSRSSRALAHRIEKLIEKAAKHCEDGNMVVFAHLANPEIVPKKDYEHLIGIMSGKWKSYFSSLYRDTRWILSNTIAPNQLHFEKTILPILIQEDGAQGKQYRILLEELNEDGLIDMHPYKDILFKMPDGTFRNNEKSPQSDRYEALKEINRYLRTPEGRVFAKRFGVAVTTGEIITVEPPPTPGI
ncbi:MAG: hypothetical protein H6865_05980 [Rhodospirillales bacterium]|nr:hypothetical protein [Alphaproteobacteria bacterium]MCB9987171.1 hypothetical protein [Rhodospirillales bacterium]USO07965.1 MAG: hypothetical protein H6866_01720 [Rhodospirillales bacterium]